MSDNPAGSSSEGRSLPNAPNLDWLRKRAKNRLAERRAQNPRATLAEAQLELAREYGFPNWRALKRHIDERSVDGGLFAAAENGDAAELARLLEAHPDRLHARNRPYEHTLLHVAAGACRLDAVNLLLVRGIDPNVREKGDNTYPMHWAAAKGCLDIVRRLADAGGDVVGSGDDHALEVIGWASCFGHHRDIADFLLSRGARHHIFSAIALDLPDEVRRIVQTNPNAIGSRMSRNENHQTPLHFAVREGRTAMVELLLELGADPLAVDGSGFEAAAYSDSPETDRAVMTAIRRLTTAEFVSAERGSRPVQAGARDLIAALALHDWAAAARLVADVPTLLSSGGVLHIMSKRNAVPAVRWLLERGANPSALWAHWDADVTPLHLAALGGHPEIVRLLLAAGADPGIHDSKHDSDAEGWARFFLECADNRKAERQEVARLLSDANAAAEAEPIPLPDADALLPDDAAPLFEEPFNDPKTLARDWNATPGMIVRRRVLQFAPDDQGFFLGVTRRSDFSDFALTVDIRIVRRAAGLVLRAVAPDRYYMIQFDIANDPSVVWFHTFTPAATSGYRLKRVRTRHVPREGEWHRMRIVAHGHRFEVFLADAGGPLHFCALWEDSEHAYAQGAIGMWEAGGEAAEYRALRVDPLVRTEA